MIRRLRQMFAVEGGPLAGLREACGVDIGARRHHLREELRQLFQPNAGLVIGRGLVAPGRTDPHARQIARLDRGEKLVHLAGNDVPAAAMAACRIRPCYRRARRSPG